MILDVPYLSQLHDILRPEWKTQGCSIVCLAMALRYLRPNDALAPDALFAEGLAINGQNENGDWTHGGIVRLARNHGLHAYAQEFRSLTNDTPSIYEDRMVEEGIAKLRAALHLGIPAIISVPGRREGGPHAVLLVGEEDGMFVIHNPDADDEEGGKGVKIAVSEWKKTWRKFAIFFEKST